MSSAGKVDLRATANCRSQLQTRSLVREGAPPPPQHGYLKCPTVITILSWADTKMDWPTDRQSQDDLT
jgi:hypothetical protein